MVGMQMTDADQREIAQLGLRLTEAQIGAAPHVDEHSCLAADPKQITRRRPLPVDGRPAGPENLHGRRPRRAALRRRAGREGEDGHAARDEGLEKLDHKCTSQWRGRSLHFPFFANPASRRKNAFGGPDCTQMGVYSQQPKGQRVNSGEGRRKTMSSHESRILAVIAAGVLFVGVQSIRAADFDGSVQGVVKTASGQALPGAYVKLINPERRLTFMVVSQAQGRYEMNNLPPGDYTVQGIGNGFQSKLTPVALTGGKTATTDVALTDKQAEVPNGWVRSPGRVAGNELDHQLQPPNMPEGAGKAIMEAKCTQCHFLWRATQQRWSHDHWEKKIA